MWQAGVKCDRKAAGNTLRGEWGWMSLRKPQCLADRQTEEKDTVSRREGQCKTFRETEKDKVWGRKGH